MKKGDHIWLVALLGFVGFLILPTTHELFVKFTTDFPYMGGFVKFAILATMGELLAIRIATGDWYRPKGIIYRGLIWGLLGMVIVLIFNVFAGGIQGALKKGLLPGENSALAFAFFTSAVMNLTFAPTMMAFHRITDTYIDLKYSGQGRVKMKDVTDHIDWHGFVSFVVLKTIPFFWIPAHTITFLLPPEYRVLAAAFLSLALGAILAFAKKKQSQEKQIKA